MSNSDDDSDHGSMQVIEFLGTYPLVMTERYIYYLAQHLKMTEEELIRQVRAQHPELKIIKDK